MSVATDLRAAADYLRTYGWIQGAYGRRGVARCIAGALASVVPRRSFERVYAAVQVVTVERVSIFNDHHCKSADDAIAVLEIAADLAG